MIPPSTDRLLIRPFVASDAGEAWEMYGDPDVTRFLDWQRPTLEEYRIHFQSRMDAWAKYAEGQGVWALIEKASDRLAGLVMLKPIDEEASEIELGYHLARWAWGRGYATEASRAVLEHGFTNAGLDRIVAAIHPDNAASVRVVERLGMTPADDREYDGVTCRMFISESGSART